MGGQALLGSESMKIRIVGSGNVGSALNLVTMLMIQLGFGQKMGTDRTLRLLKVEWCEADGAALIGVDLMVWRR
jgi:malate/lactate dehydrogenase